MRPADDFKQTRINTTELFRRYSEQEIIDILARDLAKRAAVLSAERTSRVTFGSREKAGMAGPETYAEVKIVVDHDPPPKEGLVEKLDPA